MKGVVSEGKPVCMLGDTRVRAEEVVHACNVITFFVWVWPSGFCD